MKLGEMLVRDGRLKEDQLEEAIALQGRDGGRLGSLLVQLGHIDAETLTVYLGLDLGIPIATGATLERCKRSAVKLLTPEQAVRFRCIPIVIQGQTLIVAVDDPHDLIALDQLSTLTGYRVLPRVAPEIRIFYYLHRFYGAQIPRRFRELGDSVRGSREKSASERSLPAPPLPGLPPKVETPKQAPNEAPKLRRRKTDPPPTPAKAKPRGRPKAVEPEALELDAADLVEELDSDDAEVAEQTAEPTGVSNVRPGRARRASKAIPAVFEPLEYDEALKIINTTEQRTEIADAVLGHLTTVFSVGALMLVRDNMAFGWKGFGPDLEADRIETFLVPLDVPSMFQVAMHSEGLYRGRAFPASFHDHWFKLLRSAVPNYSFVFELRIGSRPVNLIYGHAEDGGDIGDTAVDQIRSLLKATSGAYIRLISVTKSVTVG